MVINAGYWEPYIHNQFIRQVTMFVDSIETRLLPTFYNIENEAKKVEKEEFDNLLSECYNPDIDPADLAETAHDAGFDYYYILSGVKQSLINISAVTLYHLFEQQSLFFLHRVLLEPLEEKKKYNLSVFKKRCRQYNIRIGSFSSWQTINEMKDVSNAVKHAEGRSAGNLRKIKPDIFTHPLLEKDYFNVTHPLIMPLSGEDLYLSVKDIKTYGDSIVIFWNEIISAMYLQNQ